MEIEKNRQMLAKFWSTGKNPNIYEVLELKYLA